MNGESIKKIGNFCGRLILGTYADKIVETAVKVGNIERYVDTIIETATKVKNIEKEVENISSLFSCQDKEITCMKVNIAVLQTKVYGQAGSPMKPNEKGEKLLDDSGFKEIYPEIRAEIFASLDEMKTRTVYDAEKNSFIALDRLVDSPKIDRLKNYVVNHPDETLNMVFVVASWVIRDDYTKERQISN